VNKHLYLCHPLVLSSPTLMMRGHMNLKFSGYVNLINIKVKDKAPPLNTMNTYRGSKGKAPLVLNLGTR